MVLKLASQIVQSRLFMNNFLFNTNNIFTKKGINILLISLVIFFLYCY